MKKEPHVKLVIYKLVCRFALTHQTAIYTKWHIPDVVFIQLILLMMDAWLHQTCRV